MTRYKKIIFIIFIFSVTLGLKGIIDPIDFRFCNPDCDEFIFYLALSIPLLLISSLLFFLRHEVFTAWIKFAAFGFPVMLGGLLYYFNIKQSTGGWIGGPTESQVASVVLPGLFLIISFILIISKSIQLKAKDKNTPRI